MAVQEDFETFWRAFPRKTGKLDAQRAYVKARKVASAEQILTGIDRYLAAKPDYADYCYPATFLNKGRFLDEPDEAPASRVWTCSHQPRCGSEWRCDQTTKLAEARMWRAS